MSRTSHRPADYARWHSRAWVERRRERQRRLSQRVGTAPSREPDPLLWLGDDAPYRGVMVSWRQFFGHRVALPPGRLP